MALNSNGLAEEILKALEVQGFSRNEHSMKIWTTIASGIIKHIKENAAIAGIILDSKGKSCNTQNAKIE